MSADLNFTGSVIDVKKVQVSIDKMKKVIYNIDNSNDYCFRKRK